jgi:hypothetical protein
MPEHHKELRQQWVLSDSGTWEFITRVGRPQGWVGDPGQGHPVIPHPILIPLLVGFAFGLALGVLFGIGVAGVVSQVLDSLSTTDEEWDDPSERWKHGGR